MPRRRRRPHNQDVDIPLDGPDIPPPAVPIIIDGPTAHELAAHGSEFMTQALLVFFGRRGERLPVECQPGDEAFSENTRREKWWTRLFPFPRTRNTSPAIRDVINPF